MRNPEVTYGLRIVHRSSNLEPYEQMLNLEKQNRKISMAIHAKTHNIKPQLKVFKKRSDRNNTPHIISINKIAQNPHLIFIT